MNRVTDPSLLDLWLSLQQPLKRYIIKRVGDAQVAEDLLQDIFVRVHTHITTLRNPARLQAWIYQIARNTISDYFRAQRQHAVLTEDLLEEGAEEESLGAELAPAVRRMIDALPPESREALVLSDIQGMSQVELARHLAISIPAAKSRVQRARARVRQMLLDCCHFEFDRLGGVTNYYPRIGCCQRCGHNDNQSGECSPSGTQYREEIA